MTRIDPTKFVTVTHAAAIAGVSRFWMLQKAQNGGIDAVCIDGVWFVRRDAAASYQRTSRGRPRNPKP